MKANQGHLIADTHSEVLLLDRMQAHQQVKKLGAGFRKRIGYADAADGMDKVAFRLKTDILKLAKGMADDQVRHIYFAAGGGWVSAKSARAALRRL